MRKKAATAQWLVEQAADDAEGNSQIPRTDSEWGQDSWQAPLHIHVHVVVAVIAAIFQVSSTSECRTPSSERSTAWPSAIPYVQIACVQSPEGKRCL